MSPLRMARAFVFPGLVVGLVALAACAPAQPAATQVPAKPAAPTAAAKAAAPAQPAATTAAAKPAAKADTAEREKLLNQLVEGAKKEGELNIFGVSSATAEGGAALVAAFNKRFGLNLKVKYVLEGTYGGVWGQALTETKSGVPPTFDVLNGPDERPAVLCPAGGCQKIDKWEMLLPEGVDPKVASSGPVAGQAFVFSTRTKATVYNTKLITEAQLPRDVKEVGDPKYKGKFYTSPWTTAHQYMLLKYSKDEYLDMVKKWGENKAATIPSNGGVERMMLGEFSFEPFSNAYYHYQQLALGNPSGVHLFNDLVPNSQVLHVVPTGARHPNAAKLFALWATGAEFNATFEKFAGTGHIGLPSSKIGQAEKELMQKGGAKVVTWLDNQETLDLLKWWSTPEGQAYDKELSKALQLQ